MNGLPYALALEIMLSSVKGIVFMYQNGMGRPSVASTQGSFCFKEFSWVVLRIGKLHMELNMSELILKLTWEVFISELAYVQGFTTEAAQNYAKKGTSIHHSMTVRCLQNDFNH